MESRGTCAATLLAVVMSSYSSCTFCVPRTIRNTFSACACNLPSNIWQCKLVSRIPLTSETSAPGLETLKYAKLGVLANPLHFQPLGGSYLTRLIEVSSRGCCQKIAGLIQDDEWVDLLEMATLCEAVGRLRKKTWACKRKRCGRPSWPGFQKK